MAFADKETSRYSGQPVELYLFRYGSQAGSYYAYTNAENDITFNDGDGDKVYKAVPISRESVKSSGTLDKSALSLRAAKDLSMSEIFRDYPPAAVVTLTIRQGHLDDPDNEFLVAWAGRVLSYERDGSERVMSAEPVSTSLRRSGLRRFYQIPCPHYLYGPDCRASRAAATVTGTVTAVSGYDVTLAPGWNAHSAEKYRQGEFSWTSAAGETVTRMILKTSGNTLTLAGALLDLAVGDTVNVTLGCNHQTSPTGDGVGDCTNLHNNGQNYGGCKWIPTKNPIKSASSEFY
jgi:hypothetical protein